MKSSFFAVCLLAGVSVASASPPSTVGGLGANTFKSDNLKHPLGARQFALRQKGLQAQARGFKGGVYKVSDGQFVNLRNERTDKVFVGMVEFGDIALWGGPPGPLHNSIEEPNRKVDNTTAWAADYDKDHYTDLYFNQMNDYYVNQSSGRYALEGEVSDWIELPFSESTYDANDICGGNICSVIWYLVQHFATEWVNHQLARGLTIDQVREYLQQFDVYDRYDYNGNGNFNEPDGYIDHMQFIHAGVGQEAGGGAQGAYAIWSHRWYAFYNLIGAAGPAINKLGGVEFPGTGIWIGDYTINPENGGLGVIAHEYAHDLGLPDQYDTAGGSNSTGFWTIMSSGSWLGTGEDTIGDRPGDFNAWEKFQLGWLNYEAVSSTTTSAIRLGPAEANTRSAQAAIVVLPNKQVTTTLAVPTDGSNAWYSGAGDDIEHTMTRQVHVPAGTATITADVWYRIEQDWDYAYVEVSSDNGGTWIPLAAPGVTTTDDPNGQNQGNGITGRSGGWLNNVAFDLQGMSGDLLLRFRYWTDPYVQEEGIMIDRVQAGDLFENAESGTNGWTLNGFRTSTGQESSFHFNAYIAEYRQYRGYDKTLQTGPYNFGWYPALPDYVEHYPYQQGLLITYWDTSFTDNNTSMHPGGGLILPVDAHPAPRNHQFGPWSSRVQAFDSTFGLWDTDAFTLHLAGVPSYFESLPANPVFDDRESYWSPQTPWASVKVPNTGTRIEVTSTNALDGFMQIRVGPAANATGRDL